MEPARQPLPGGALQLPLQAEEARPGVAPKVPPAQGVQAEEPREEKAPGRQGVHAEAAALL